MAHLIKKYGYNKKWFEENCPVLLNEEESIKHIFEHANLINDIAEDCGIEADEAEKLCAVMNLDKTREPASF